MATPNVKSLSMDELTSMPRAELEALVRAGAPIDVRFGADRLRVLFGVVDGAVRIEVMEVVAAGDGVLMNFASGCRNLARQSRATRIDWIVHASACAAPNERLQGTLTSRGFALQDVPGIGQAYRRSEPIG
jgi:hypothetical protein